MRFAAGLEEIIVVEEKRGLIEEQIKERLFNSAERPARVVGKRDETGAVLFRETTELSADEVTAGLGRRLAAFDDSGRLSNRLSHFDPARGTSGNVSKVSRTPYFCSGCPHNTSTKVPEGSRALAGIGCHFLAQGMDRKTATYTQMGGEGASWIGQAPFSSTEHIFVNLGDGTYFHSGLLAIRAAVASGANGDLQNIVQRRGGDDRRTTGRWLVGRGANHPSGRGGGSQSTLPWSLMSRTSIRWAVGLPRVTKIYHRDDLDSVQRGSA